MDSFLSARVAMSGWLFLAVIITSLWATNSPEWVKLLELVKSSNGTVTLALFGAIVGVGGPPALGFIFERIISVCLFSLERNSWNYPVVRDFRKEFSETLKVQPEFYHPVSDGGIFHTFFTLKPM